MKSSASLLFSCHAISALSHSSGSAFSRSLAARSPRIVPVAFTPMALVRMFDAVLMMRPFLWAVGVTGAAACCLPRGELLLASIVTASFPFVSSCDNAATSSAAHLATL